MASPSSPAIAHVQIWLGCSPPPHQHGQIGAATTCPERDWAAPSPALHTHIQSGNGLLPCHVSATGPLPMLLDLGWTSPPHPAFQYITGSGLGPSTTLPCPALSIWIKVILPCLPLHPTLPMSGLSHSSLPMDQGLYNPSQPGQVHWLDLACGGTWHHTSSLLAKNFGHRCN